MKKKDIKKAIAIKDRVPDAGNEMPCFDLSEYDMIGAQAEPDEEYGARLNLFKK